MRVTRWSGNGHSCYEIVPVSVQFGDDSPAQASTSRNAVLKSLGRNTRYSENAITEAAPDLCTDRRPSNECCSHKSAITKRSPGGR